MRGGLPRPAAASQPANQHAGISQEPRTGGAGALCRAVAAEPPSSIAARDLTLDEDPGAPPYVLPIYTWLMSNSLIDRIS